MRLAEELDSDLVPSWEDPSGRNDPTTPAVVRFDLIAPLTSTAGVRTLGKAAANVAQHIRANTKNPSPLSQHQLDLLADLAGGLRVMEVAQARGYSTRSLYRELASMWAMLGVENKQQGIAIALNNGWLNLSGP